MRTRCRIFFFCLVIGFTDGVFGENDPAGQPPPTRLAAYYGTYSNTDLLDILTKGKTEPRPSYISVLAVSRPLQTTVSIFHLEPEMQIARHTGVQKHLEMNGVLLARYDTTLLNLPLSLAVGEGLSIATHNPDLENPRPTYLNWYTEPEYSSKILNYLAFEAAVGVPRSPVDSEVFVRVHHRSGIYGVLCPPTCGSNFVAYGVRLSLF